LCKYCENFSFYTDALDDVLTELREVYDSSDVEEPEELDVVAKDVNYAKLFEFSGIDRRINKVKLLLCENAFESENRDCIEGRCGSCGFKKIWSDGLRKMLVDKDGNLKAGVHPVWLKTVQWWRYKTSAPSNSVSVDDSNSEKETLKQHRQGSIIDFIDEFEAHTWKKYPSHRFTLHKTREAVNELHQNAQPGTLRSDRDWSERYTMIDAREIQSQYWHQKQVGLLISISRLLLSSAYVATTGELTSGTEVTVELPSQKTPFFAIVKSGLGSNEGSLYEVESLTGDRHTVQRQYLRERKWHTVAFVGVTGDKKQDSYATDFFIKKELEWWESKYVKPNVEPVTMLYTHTDNAATHFKSGAQMFFLSCLLTLFAWLQAGSMRRGNPLLCGGVIPEDKEIEET